MIAFIGRLLARASFASALTSVDPYDLYLVHQPFAFPLALVAGAVLHQLRRFRGLVRIRRRSPWFRRKGPDASATRFLHERRENGAGQRAALVCRFRETDRINHAADVGLDHRRVPASAWRRGRLYAESCRVLGSRWRRRSGVRAATRGAGCRRARHFRASPARSLRHACSRQMLKQALGRSAASACCRRAVRRSVVRHARMYPRIPFARWLRSNSGGYPSVRECFTKFP